MENPNIDSRFNFRMWDTFQKRWRDADISYVSSLRYGRSNGFIYQQSTGVADKNGEAIFEGDILEVKGQLIGTYFREGETILSSRPPNTVHTWLAKVIWDNGYASYLLEYINQPNYQGRGRFKDKMIGVAPWAKIVGNIFDNPDLLKTA